jgi:hypothetical protein
MEDRLHEIEEEIARAEVAIALCETGLQSFVSAEETQRQTQELASPEGRFAELDEGMGRTVGDARNRWLAPVCYEQGGVGPTRQNGDMFHVEHCTGYYVRINIYIIALYVKQTMRVTTRLKLLDIRVLVPALPFNSVSTCRAISFSVSKTPTPWKATASMTGSFFLRSSLERAPTGRYSAGRACSVAGRRESC